MSGECYLMWLNVNIWLMLLNIWLNFNIWLSPGQSNKEARISFDAAEMWFHRKMLKICSVTKKGGALYVVKDVKI